MTKLTLQMTCLRIRDGADGNKLADFAAKAPASGNFTLEFLPDAVTFTEGNDYGVDVTDLGAPVKTEDVAEQRSGEDTEQS